MNQNFYTATTNDDIEKLRSFWLKENRHPDADIDFYKMFVASNPEGMKPHVVVATEDDTIKALLLGRMEYAVVTVKLAYLNLLKLRVRQFVSLQDGYLGDENPKIKDEMIRQLDAHVRNGAGDRAVLSNLPINSGLFELARSVPSFLCRDYANRTASRWKTTLPASLEDFLKRRSKKHRYWLKRIGRVFEDEHPGKVRYQTFQTSQDLENFCRLAEKVAQTTYQRGLGVGFLNDTATRGRLELAVAKGWLRGYVMFLGDDPVAFWCGRLYKGVMVLDWTGYLPEYRKYELGTILFLKMVEDLCNSKAKEIDYGTGTSFYKERFGDEETLEGYVSIHAPTVKGLLTSALTAFDVRFNRAAKAVAGKLKVGDKLKRIWRSKLSSQVKKEGAPESGKAAEGASRSQPTP